jgi:hypothetical protein
MYPKSEVVKTIFAWPLLTLEETVVVQKGKKKKINQQLTTELIIENDSIPLMSIFHSLQTE